LKSPVQEEQSVADDRKAHAVGLILDTVPIPNRPPVFYDSTNGCMRRCCSRIQTVIQKFSNNRYPLFPDLSGRNAP
jgi:hypothetical protein